jgi:hypothetical protein
MGMEGEKKTEAMYQPETITEDLLYEAKEKIILASHSEDLTMDEAVELQNIYRQLGTIRSNVQDRKEENKKTA